MPMRKKMTVNQSKLLLELWHKLERPVALCDRRIVNTLMIRGLVEIRPLEKYPDVEMVKLTEKGLAMMQRIAKASAAILLVAVLSFAPAPALEARSRPARIESLPVKRIEPPCLMGCDSEASIFATWWRAIATYARMR